MFEALQRTAGRNPNYMEFKDSRITQMLFFFFFNCILIEGQNIWSKRLDYFYNIDPEQFYCKNVTIRSINVFCHIMFPTLIIKRNLQDFIICFRRLASTYRKAKLLI